MDYTEIDKLTRELMADSKLKLTNPIFDGVVMNQILLEANKIKNRKTLVLNILIFAGIELILFALLSILLIHLPGSDYFASIIKNSMVVFQKIGKLAIEYDYLIFSFIVVGVLDKIMNKKATVSVRS